MSEKLKAHLEPSLYKREMIQLFIVWEIIQKFISNYSGSTQKLTVEKNLKLY